MEMLLQVVNPGTKLCGPKELNTTTVRGSGNIGRKTPIWVQHKTDFVKQCQVLLPGGLALDFDVVILNGTKVREEQRQWFCVPGGVAGA